MGLIEALRERAAQLPRDTRDTLFHLAVLAWASAPHLLHLPLWCGGMTVLLLLWRARLSLKGAALPSRWLIAGVLVLAAALTIWGERTLLGKEAGITMLVVLMALKTLELRARRDALVVFFLGFFLVLTNFLYSQSLLTGLWLLVAVWGLLTALVLAHMPVGRPPLARAGGVAARSALFGLPLMVLLFVLFPRIGPLWGLPQDAAGRTGLSGTMRLGGVANLAEDDAIAMRVRFFGDIPRPHQMYFRGPVLSRFDGREWSRLVSSFNVADRPRLELELRGEPMRYEMTIEPSRLPLLPLLEISPDRDDVAPRADGWLFTLRPDAQWQTDRPVIERLRVEASVWPDHRHGPRQEVLGLRDLVDLPPASNPRTLQWAAELRREPALANADASTLADAVLKHIATAGFTYTLEPGPYGSNGGASNDAIDEFWLDRKLGFCEHFASAFVVIMRALDVPSRIVTGYQGTDLEPVDGYWIVRQRNAHAWAEIWQAGVGWIRVDPTAAVAPDRIQRGRSLAPAPGLVAGAFNSLDPALVLRLRRGWEGLNNQWNQWVLNYSRGQQFDLMRSLGFAAPSWQDLAILLILLLCCASLAGAAWAFWDRRRQDPWQRLQRKVLESLQALGVAALPSDPPRTRALRVREALAERGEDLAALLEGLDAERYDSGSAAPPRRDWWRRFKAAVRASAGASNGSSARASQAAVMLLALSLASSAIAAPRKPKPAEPAYGSRPTVLAFAAEVAERRGLPREWLVMQLAQARRIEAVRKLIMPPPAGTAKNWAAYRAIFVEPKRIAAGLAFWRANEDWLVKAEERFGVPAEIVVAIVGVESFYGRHMGGFRTLDALATLSFDFPPGRKDRSDFFRTELEEFLVLCAREGSDPQTVKGSFAGAMGLPQFMPGSLNRVAIDLDGDGHIDLLNSAADVVGSVSNFLADAGWQRGMPTHYAVAVPVDASDRAALLGPDILPSFSAAQFAERGALLDDAGRDHIGALALVELQNGALAPSYVAGTQNFYAVTRYNRSSYYAMAVIELAQALSRARGASAVR